MRILDLGGTPAAWRAAPVVPAHVTSVNLDEFTSDDDRFEVVKGDACNLPAHIRSAHYDLVFSNSLLEHLGGHAMRQRFSDSVYQMAPHHWIQTPYRYFPIEPHWLFPGMQFLPYAARVAVSLRWNRGHIRTYTRESAQKEVDEVELIGVAQTRSLFPASEIMYEKFAGLIKSLIAVR